MAEKRFYWLKLKNDFFNNKIIKKLRKIAGGDTYIIIYLKLQLLSLKHEGQLFFEGVEETFFEEIALELDEDIDNIKITLLFLEKHNLLERIENSTYFLPETVKNIGSESSIAARVRKYRKNKELYYNKEEKALQSNTDVTFCNTEIEKREKRKELETELNIDNTTRARASEREFKNVLKLCFDKFYFEYPRHVKPNDAEKAFTKAVKQQKIKDCDVLKVFTEKLIDAVKLQVSEYNNKNGTDYKYFPYPSSWLNSGSWKNEVDLRIPNQKNQEPKKQSHIQKVIAMTKKLHEEGY